MNILDFLSDSLRPISSSILSLISALISTIITEKMLNNSKKDLRVKINNQEITLNGFDEKEVIELLKKLNVEENK